VSGGREQAAQLRAVREREANSEAALARQPELAAIKKQQDKNPEEARSSTTDAVHRSRIHCRIVNAPARNRTLNRLQGRGLKRVKGVAPLFALVHNLMRTVSLAPQLVGLGTGTSAIPRNWHADRQKGPESR